MKNSSISFSIFDSHAEEWKGNGIQWIGFVSKIAMKDIKDALDIYSTDFLSKADFENKSYTLFQITITRAFILDPSGNADTRVEVTL